MSGIKLIGINEAEIQKPPENEKINLPKIPELRILNILAAKELFSISEMQQKMEDLIYESLGDITSDHMGKIEQWNQIDELYPDNTKIIVKGDELCGFWTFVPLSEEYFEKAKQGRLKEAEITHEILDILVGGEYKGYFLDIVISPLHRTYEAYPLLFDAFIKQIEQYAEHGIFFDEWCANGYTNEGKKLCKMYGLKYICDHEQEGEGEIYYLKMDEETLNRPILKKYPRLIELYKQHFDL